MNSFPVRRAILLAFCISVTAFAQQKTVFEDLPALVLSNDKVSLTVITEGGAMAQILLADDKEKINPIWNPYWIARQAGLSRPTSFFRGHFACLDGFGPVIGRGARCGIAVPRRGVHAAVGCCSRIRRQGGTLSAAFSVTLPLAHETFARTYHIVDGENIVWVDSAVTSLLAFDRPVFWGEHATISAPFLEPGKVAVDMPVREVEDEGRSGAAERCRVSCGRLSISPGRWRRLLTARVRCAFCADEAEHDSTT